jgi:hypothetical protein
MLLDSCENGGTDVQLSGQKLNPNKVCCYRECAYSASIVIQSIRDLNVACHLGYTNTEYSPEI